MPTPIPPTHASFDDDFNNPLSGQKIDRALGLLAWPEVRRVMGAPVV